MLDSLARHAWSHPRRFTLGALVFLKELGVGGAVAVLLDAFVVRALLVPSLMALLGRWNWWSPGALRRLHARIGVVERAEVRATSTSTSPS